AGAGEGVEHGVEFNRRGNPVQPRQEAVLAPHETNLGKQLHSLAKLGGKGFDGLARVLYKRSGADCHDRANLDGSPIVGYRESGVKRKRPAPDLPHGKSPSRVPRRLSVRVSSRAPPSGDFFPVRAGARCPSPPSSSQERRCPASQLLVWKRVGV